MLHCCYSRRTVVLLSCRLGLQSQDALHIGVTCTPPPGVSNGLDFLLRTLLSFSQLFSYENYDIASAAADFPSSRSSLTLCRFLGRNPPAGRLR